MKKISLSFILPVALWLTGFNRASAQCDAPTSSTVTSSPALCFGAGSVTVTSVNGAAVSNDGTMRYQLVYDSAGSANNLAVVKPWQSSPVFNAVGYGSYFVQMETVCASDLSTTYTSASVTVTGITTVPLGAGITLVQNAAECGGNIGSVSVSLSTPSAGGGGALSYYTYQLLSARDITTNVTPQQSSNIFNNLAAGTYYAAVYDSCGNYSISTSSVTVQTIADAVQMQTSLTDYCGDSARVGLQYTYQPNVGKGTVAIQPGELFQYTYGGTTHTLDVSSSNYVNGVLTPAPSLLFNPPNYPISLDMIYTSPCGKVTTYNTVIQQPPVVPGVTITPPTAGADCTHKNVTFSTTGGYANISAYSIDSGATWTYPAVPNSGSFTASLATGATYTILMVTPCNDTMRGTVTVPPATTSLNVRLYQYLFLPTCGPNGVPGIALSDLSGATGAVFATVVSQPAGATIPTTPISIPANPNATTVIGASSNLVPGTYTFNISDDCGTIQRSITIGNYIVSARAVPTTSASCDAPQTGVTFSMNVQRSGSGNYTYGGERYIVTDITAGGAGTVVINDNGNHSYSIDQFGNNQGTGSGVGSFYINATPGVHTYVVQMSSTTAGACVTTDTVTVTVPPAGGALSVGGAIFTSICGSTSSVIALTAVGGGGSYTYQLQQTTDNGATWNNVGASNTTGIFNGLTETNVYRVWVTDACANGIYYSSTFSSDPVSLKFSSLTKPCSGDLFTMSLPYIAGATYSWKVNGNTTATTTNNYTVTVPAEGGSVNTYQGFVTLGSCLVSSVPYTLNPADCGQPLPITLQRFTAQAKGSTALLHWTTAAEINNKGFEIQRSNDATNWKAITFVNSQAVNGNSSSSLSYSFTDKNPATGINYYRLKQEDLNGNSVYSSVQNATFGSANAIGIVPNPARSTATITGLKGGETVRVFSAGGSKVFEQSNVPAGNFTLHISHWTAGVYFVRIIGTNVAVQHIKLIVK